MLSMFPVWRPSTTSIWFLSGFAWVFHLHERCRVLGEHISLQYWRYPSWGVRYWLCWRVLVVVNSAPSITNRSAIPPDTFSMLHRYACCIVLVNGEPSISICRCQSPQDSFQVLLTSVSHSGDFQLLEWRRWFFLKGSYAHLCRCLVNVRLETSIYQWSLLVFATYFFYPNDGIAREWHVFPGAHQM